MKDYMITFRSVTFAQRAERALQQSGIDCILRRTPRELSSRGCGYCLQLRGAQALTAAELLRFHQIPFEKVYAPDAGGKMEERLL